MASCVYIKQTGPINVEGQMFLIIKGEQIHM